MKLKFFAITILVSGFIYLSKPANVSAAYPISELGNCRDGQECKLYCEVPANTPACWSYGKYIMNRDVLGDTAVSTPVNITYPIPDLGNCSSAQDCFIYCNQPQNQPTCLAYARKNGLVKETSTSPPANMMEIIQAAKSELGCDGKDACMAFCSDPANADKCRAFAQKHGLNQSGPPPQTMAKAKTQLGCGSEDACEKFCENPDNQTKCFEFAKNNGLMPKDEADKMEQMMEQRKKMLEAAKDQLECDSMESCFRLCSIPQNRDKCMSLARQFNITSNNPPNMNTPNNNPSLGCRTQEECKEYCQKHPDQCPGFPRPASPSISPPPQGQQPTPPYNTQSYQNYPPATVISGYPKPVNAYPTLNTTYPPPSYSTSYPTGNYPPPTNFPQ